MDLLMTEFDCLKWPCASVDRTFKCSYSLTSLMMFKQDLFSESLENYKTRKPEGFLMLDVSHLSVCSSCC